MWHHVNTSTSSSSLITLPNDKKKKCTLVIIEGICKRQSYMPKMIEIVFNIVENIVIKGENTNIKHLLFFP